MKPVIRFVLPLAALGLLTYALVGQTTSHENDVRDRGQTPVQPPGISMDYGRIGSEASVPSGPIAVHGWLLDASCMNRAPSNLFRSPASAPNSMPPAGTMQAANSGNSSADGITVDAATLARERADIMAHQVPDMLARQGSPNCAITASTREYALVLPNGRLLNLDYGGDTLANEVVYASPEGQKMLNGAGPAFKLPVTVKGRVFGDKLVVEQLFR